MHWWTNLHWFDVTLDTPMAQIGWVWIIIVLLLLVLMVLIRGLILDGYRLRLSFRKCEHLHTRCLHGDEIHDRMKVHVLRFWREEVIRRQICTDCGAALDRRAICTTTGEDIHTWIGYWR